MWKTVYILSQDSSKGDDKSAKGNGKNPSMQDSNGEANLAIIVQLYNNINSIMQEATYTLNTN
jgi:hypothetical protein